VVAQRVADLRPARADGELLGVQDRREVDGLADLGGARPAGGDAGRVVAA
jgi:hypothetical protein